MDITNPYGFWFAQTHGIWVGSDGSWWVIEISRSAGVTAWRVPSCRVMTDDEREYYGVDLPFYPRRESNPAVDERIELLSVDDMEDFLDGSQLYPFCGWSFNQAGNEAVNTTIKFVSDWKQTTLWKIAITGGETPVSASLTEEDKQYFIIENGGGSHLKYPGFNAGTPTLLSLDLAYDVSEEPPGGNNPAPLKAFYDTEDNLIVIYVARIPGGDVGTSDAPPQCMPPDPADFGSYVGKGLWGAPQGCEYTTIGTNYFIITNNGSMIAGDAPTSDIQISRVDPAGSYFINVTARVDWSTYFTSGTDYIFEIHWEGTYTKIVPDGDGEQHTGNVLILPFFESTAFYFYTNTSAGTDSGYWEISRSGGQSGKWYYPRDQEWEWCDGKLGYIVNTTSIWYQTGTQDLIAWGAGGLPLENGPQQSYCGYDEFVGWDRVMGVDPLQGGGCIPYASGTGEPYYYTSEHSLKYYMAGDFHNLTISAPDPKGGSAPEGEEYTRVVTGDDAPQLMAMYLDTHHNAGPISAEMDGLAGETYEYIGNTQNRYPLEDLPDNLWRAWFGAPNPEGT